jgi:hypothetical protein
MATIPELLHTSVDYLEDKQVYLPELKNTSASYQDVRDEIYPILFHASYSFTEKENVDFPAVFHLSYSFESEYFNLLLKPKRRDDAQNLSECTIINYTNIAELSPGVPIRDDVGGIIYLRVTNPANPFSLTLRTEGKKDVVFTNVTLDGSCPVGLDRQVTLYISSDDSKVNGAAFDGENQILI